MNGAISNLRKGFTLLHPGRVTGFTTGTCAQAAAKAAALMLKSRTVLDSVEIQAPNGEKFSFQVVDQIAAEDFAKCAVIKDSGDDPDVTNGVKIYAEVKFSDTPGILIKGGPGVGKVTKPGLSTPVGEWAINPVPRKMILQELSALLTGAKGFEVTISVPQGEKLARQTYNPKLGIIGGISIIGTTGIVEPKSLEAWKASLALELGVLKAQGIERVVLVLGYVSEKFCKEELKIPPDSIIKIGDHIGFMLEQCAAKKIKQVLLVGHLGKLIKVANGQFNTHCSFGDERINLIARYAATCGAAETVVEELLKQATAEAAIKILEAAKLNAVFEKIAQDVLAKIKVLVNSQIKLECIVLSLQGKVLGCSSSE